MRVEARRGAARLAPQPQEADWFQTICPKTILVLVYTTRKRRRQRCQ